MTQISNWQLLKDTWRRAWAMRLLLWFQTVVPDSDLAVQLQIGPLAATLKTATDRALGTLRIDPRNGRALGDHGTAKNAIDWALDGNEAVRSQEVEFLRCWQEGDLSEWPEYYDWLERRDAIAAQLTARFT